VSTAHKSALFQKLPSTDELLRQPDMQALTEREGHSAVAESIRVVLARLRQEIANGQIAGGQLDEKSLDLALGGLSAAVERQLRQSLSYSLLPLINATGVILHTNLGRAPLAAGALDRVRATASAYSNLEFDLSTGERGKRDVHVNRLFQKLLTADRAGDRVEAGLGLASAERSSALSTIVVNNNAAAVLLALNSFAEGGEVIVSRGELVEIGGSFRIPDVMSKSSATLREVGTTNRTRVADYERAINDRTRLLLRVHRSNFEITGFTEQPGLDELVVLAHRRNLPLLEDLGSGALFDLRSVGINGEPGVLDSLRAGVDIVTYSGDKLLGGPQAGLISGRADLVARMRSNSLFRALRVDKLTYAALEATLLAYVKRDHDAVPVLRMMRLSKDEIARRAEKIVSGIESTQVKSAHLKLELFDGESVIGGGAAPSAVLLTRLIALTHVDLSADELSARLRASTPPVIARVKEGRVLLDLRTVFPEQDANLATALASLN
jgi:L-seryl-tRNA(Ser) seleniumtransferase